MNVKTKLIPQVRDVRLTRAYLVQVHLGVTDRAAQSRATGIEDRHLNYHANAAECLGWLDELGQITDLGANLIRSTPDSADEAELIRASILSSSTLRVIAPNLLSPTPPSRAAMEQLMQAVGLAPSTARSRTGALLRWRDTLERRGALDGQALQLTILDSRPRPSGNSEVAKHKVVKAPDVPIHPNVRDLQRRLSADPRSVVLVTGAGVSKFSGVPLWGELRSRLLTRLREAANATGNPLSPDVEDVERLDLWTAFSRLSFALGREFIPAIRDCLRANDALGSNPVYSKFWRAGIRGVVTYNLDVIAETEYAALHRRPVHGLDHTRRSAIGDLLGPSAKDFVFHMHGVLTDPDSWVFTRDKRNEVLRSTEVESFLQRMTSRTIVFCGFGVDDFSWEFWQPLLGPTIAVSANVFAILPNDAAVIERAIDVGIRPIPYRVSADGTDHADMIRVVTEVAAVAAEVAPPSAFTDYATPPESLPPDDELFLHGAEEIRLRLNAAVAGLLQTVEPTEEAQANAVVGMFKRYPRSVHAAWLLEPDHPELNRLFGLKLEPAPLGSGAFGRVFLGSRGGRNYAIKVMNEEVKKQPGFLFSFRRGIESMRILEKRRIEGTVRVVEAYEVPPTIVMEHISGITLESAVEDRWIPDTLPRLRVLHQVTNIVRRAHGVPEVVFHRDLKPANVMLRDPEYGGHDFDVVVLDFDLSWHGNSDEKSVVHHARAQGYAAPEQRLDADSRTRSAAVDAFGFGMLCYFMFCERHPSINEHFRSTFAVDTYQALRLTSPWKCVGLSLTQLIRTCAESDQNSRPSMLDIEETLQSLVDLLETQAVDTSSPLFHLEVVARLWSPQHALSANVEEVGSGVVMSFEAGADRSFVLRRTRQGHDHRASFTKYLKTAAAKARSIVKQAELVEEVVEESMGDTATLRGTISSSKASIAMIDELVSALQAAKHELTR